MSMDESLMTTTQREMDQAMWERIKMEREEIMEAVEDYGDATLRYGMALGMEPNLLQAFGTAWDLGQRKDKAFQRLVNLIYRR